MKEDLGKIREARVRIEYTHRTDKLIARTRQNEKDKHLKNLSEIAEQEININRDN